MDHIVQKEKYARYWWVFWCGVFILTYLSRPIFDPDFFWHLKTGEWIWNNKSLPTYDPFTMTKSTILSYKQKFILTSYWLSQLIYYFSTQILSWWGIFVLRIFTSFYLFYFVYKRCENSFFGKNLLMVVFGYVFLSTYPLERPQVFSFLCFAVLLCLLEKISEKKKSIHGVYLCILMFLWSNLHGGFVLGQLTIIFFLCLVCFNVYIKKNIDKKHFVYIGLCCIFALISSLANPNWNFINNIMLITEKNQYLIFNDEYKSFFDIFYEKTNGIPSLIIGIFFLVYIIKNQRKIISFSILIAIITGILGFYQIRYMPFFLISATPLAVAGVEEYGSRNVIKIFLCAVLMVQTVVFLPFELKNIEQLRSEGFVRDSPYTPVEAVNFIVENKFQGNILNAYNWGGYLIYRLSPDRKIYIDGRTLYDKSFREWCAISGMAAVKDYPRENIFDDMVKKYDFKYVLIPKYVKSGISLMADDLNKRKDWKVVFHNPYAVIFAKQ